MKKITKGIMLLIAFTLFSCNEEVKKDVVKFENLVAFLKSNPEVYVKDYTADSEFKMANKKQFYKKLKEAVQAEYETEDIESPIKRFYLREDNKAKYIIGLFDTLNGLYIQKNDTDSEKGYIKVISSKKTEEFRKLFYTQNK